MESIALPKIKQAQLQCNDKSLQPVANGGPNPPARCILATDSPNKPIYINSLTLELKMQNTDRRMHEVTAMRFKSSFSCSAHYLVAGMLLATAVASAQNTGWRRLDSSTAASREQSADPTTPVDREDADNGPSSQAPSAGLPVRLTV